MKAATQDEVFAILTDHDMANSDDAASEAGDPRDLLDTLNAYFEGREFTTTVLGIDIYQYSRMPNHVQRVIPSLFQFFRRGAAKFCEDEVSVFVDTCDDLSPRFVPTGDGGFQMLETPLHAIAYATFMQMFITLFNGFRLFPKLRYVTGALSLRYAITSGTVFQQDGNFFGPAIIKNARILSRDTLNRCLLDSDSIEWFNRHTTSLESIAGFTLSDVLRVPGFEQRKQSKHWLIFAPPGEERPIRTVAVQKLRSVQAKESLLDIYSLHAQIGLSWTNNKTKAKYPVMVTIGNLNPEGIAV